MINEEEYNPKKYLDEIILQEIQIISGMVPMEIFTMGSKEVWLLNFEAGKFIRRNLFKWAMYLTVDDPKHLRMVNGSSAGTVRQYDLHIAHVERSRIIDKGVANLKWRWNPSVTGWFSTGTVFDISNFQGLKTLHEKDLFRLRIQKSRQEKGGIKEPTLDAEIERVKNF